MLPEKANDKPILEDGMAACALKGPTVIIDGGCVLCSHVAEFLYENSAPGNLFYFLWGQHAMTLELLDKKFRISKSEILKSWAFIENGEISRGSDAWINASKHLVFPYNIIGSIVSFVMPRCFREFLYFVVSRYRYTLFGGSADVCLKPRRPEMRNFFIHDL